MEFFTAGDLWRHKTSANMGSDSSTVLRLSMGGGVVLRSKCVRFSRKWIPST